MVAKCFCLTTGFGSTSHTHVHSCSVSVVIAGSAVTANGFTLASLLLT